MNNSIIQRRHSTGDFCVYWKSSGVVNQHGRYTYEAPIQLNCRWVDKQQEVTLPDGTRTFSSSKVRSDFGLTVTDRSIVPYHSLFLYTLLSSLSADQLSTDEPERIPGVRASLNYTAINNYRNNNKLRYVLLQ